MDNKTRCCICDISSDRKLVMSITNWEFKTGGKYNRFAIACLFGLSIYSNVCVDCMTEMIEQHDSLND